MHISVFRPASPQAGDLLWLWSACMYVCGFILAVVTISIAYITVRYRRRDDGEPNRATENASIEVAWTVIPLALVALLFGLSVVPARAVDRVTRAPHVAVAGISGGGK